ncbi:MAG: GDP-mannose 4,6-dehydratase [Candidatus Kerfeldbacteria bacterium]|nr:GDP-mannose 4,6-dehydratase [Candidatus Kerfeldbacteria bacterium]
MRTKKTAVVTGGAGFIGHHLCARLLDNGYRVVCLDNFSSGRPENVRPFRGHSRFTFYRRDITRPLRLREDVDEIYNLASPASPVDYQHRPMDTVQANTLGVYRVVALALQKRAKLLQASTSEIYGDPLEHPQPETYHGNVNHLGVRGCYEEGKRIAETIFSIHHQTYGLRLQIARIFNTYGPGMRENDGRVIPEFIYAALRNQPLTVYVGSQTRSFCYVDDLIKGLIRLQRVPKYIDPVNIGNPKEISMLQLARRVIQMTNSKSRIRILPSQTDDPRQRKPDVRKASHFLKWSPDTNFDLGLRRTIDDFRNRFTAES